MASRRKSDQYIEERRVEVNGETVTDFSYQVKPGDVVEVDGLTVEYAEETVILAMNKPKGVTTTMEDRHAEKIVVDLLPKGTPRVVPVGRLDKDSEGLLLLTNDGDLAHRLTHPSFEHEKEYVVTTNRRLTDEELARLANGIDMIEGNTGQAEVTRLEGRQFSIILKQGWRQQIRRMVGRVSAKVVALKRVRVGKLELGELPVGATRPVIKSDIV